MVTCTHCGSNNVIKAGKVAYSGGERQRHYCKDCKKFFVEEQVKISKEKEEQI